MANILNTDKQIAIVAAVAEGPSILSIERNTGVHRDTIMRLGVKIPQSHQYRSQTCNRTGAKSQCRY
ncbi:MAG: hypothetical protein P4L50_01800 [Anaerolineaceae bacterium]|nr:hypothetical protein [Anaerolineaceae bacterium]